MLYIFGQRCKRNVWFWFLILCRTDCFTILDRIMRKVRTLKYLEPLRNTFVFFMSVQLSRLCHCAVLIYVSVWV